ncbi:MAG: hypothetical protein V3T72_12640, partial [Thermoanaerobaculia bacterium]
MPRRPTLALLCCSLMTAAGCTDEPRPEPDFYLGGIQVDEEDLEHWFATLEDAGMNTVSVTEYARHGEWDSDQLSWDCEDRDLVKEIRGAEKRGLAVVLILRVELDPDLERNKFLWHGMILPHGDERIASWFDKYTRFALQWAEIAEREGVDVLMIGSELNALASTFSLTELPGLEEYYLNPDKQSERRDKVLEHRDVLAAADPRRQDGRDELGDVEEYLDARIASERAWAEQVTLGGGGTSLGDLKRRRQQLAGHWRTLIRRLRDIYRGRLGYAANFDQYRDIAFWPELDVMGINAYFKLRDRPIAAGYDPGELSARLLEGWRRALDEIGGFRTAHSLDDQPVIFTEMGYTYRLNSTLEPWADDGFSLIRFDGREQPIVWRKQPESFEERALA